ncbi:hypothetical protein WDU94_002113 [Cyamophila willieti]
MGLMQRVVKPSTARGKKHVINREPKIIENHKQTLFLQGHKTSPTAVQCLKDFYHLKKPDGKMMSRKNDILPFEDATPIEGFSKKNDASMFCFASHNKKRPNNIVLGRMYDHNLLDMFELGIENYKSLSAFPASKFTYGAKPCLIFAGEPFEMNHEYKRLQNIFVDFFQREVVKGIRLQGVEHVLSFTAANERVYLRSYRILLKKSGTRTPRVELEEIGPSVDFVLRRNKLASEELFKLACKRPKALKAKKVQNVKRDAFANKLGRVHVDKMNMEKLQTRKMKGLKKSYADRKKERGDRAVKRAAAAASGTVRTPSGAGVAKKARKA